jgi:inhibitor of KinA sporulation pathway (predicted exonuclease)
VSELGFKDLFEINVKDTSINEEGILSYKIDGICIDGLNNVKVVDSQGGNKSEFIFKRCANSDEYIEYYSKEELKNKEKYKNFNIGKSNLDKFIYAMKNNNILMKENEEAYGTVFSNSASKLINYFSNYVFKSSNPNLSENEKEQLKLASAEFVDSYIFKDLYEEIMKKFREFYKEEEVQIKKQLKENIAKFSLDELKLPNSIANCKFSGVKKNLVKLPTFKTYFEKMNFLAEINEQIFNEVKDIYKKATAKNLDIQADTMIQCWIYVLANSSFDNLIPESLFFETLLLQKDKGQNAIIVSSFVGAVKYIKNELLKNEKDINVFMVKPFVVTTQE